MGEEDGADQVAERLAYLAGMRVFWYSLAPKFVEGGDWFVAGELDAIVLCFERKISLHSKSRGGGGGGGRNGS